MVAVGFRPDRHAKALPAHFERPDPLLNPLRAVLSAFACAPCGCFDPDGQADSDGKFLCKRCLAGRNLQPSNCVYVTLLYGDTPQYILGAIALGHSLALSGTQHDRLLLHTHDVPDEARRILGEFWCLRQVDYIVSAQDLHTSPYDKARFKEVFTKLQVLNPVAVPYDKAVFLDLDTLVLRNIDELFEMRAPAAMSNFKTNEGRLRATLKHGDRMDPHCCYFNAGTMVLAPSQALYELLATDVQNPDPLWHRGAWSPEQSYLSLVWAGEWSHVSQLYNLEVQLHSGVPLSRQWEEAFATQVAVAHFSGHQKVWDCDPECDVAVMGSEWVKHTFAQLPPHIQRAVAVRCRVLHAEWHRTLASALQLCRERGLGLLEIGPVWANVLSTGDTAAFRGPTARSFSDLPPLIPPLVGDDVVFSDKDGMKRLAKVVRARDISNVSGAGSRTRLILWSTPAPSAASPFCGGPFGLCSAASLETVRPLDVQRPGADSAAARMDIGAEVIAWLGSGNIRALVVASRDDWRLLRFNSAQAPEWQMVGELLGLASDCESWQDLQCTRCLCCALGSFDVNGLWCCESCCHSAPSRLQRIL
mmetsp:Transcript_79786/g.207416  ORF Transcript_79786/g.207416 Transcript_79786/m.207416 type:complete len:588 (+) Transcript_79786:73-1836(+)